MFPMLRTAQPLTRTSQNALARDTKVTIAILERRPPA